MKFESCICRVLSTILIFLAPIAVEADQQFGQYDRAAFSAIANHEETQRGAQCLAMSIVKGEISTSLGRGAGVRLMSISLDLQDIAKDSVGSDIGYVNYETGFISALNYFIGSYEPLNALSTENDANLIMQDIEEELECESHRDMISIT